MNIEKWRKRMSDCRLITISELLKRKGIDLSPCMCFGLGEGYDFNYWIEKNVKVPMLVIVGKNKNESLLFDNLNIQYKEIDSSIDINALINEDENLIIDVDRYYLDYISNKFGRTHFGKHVLLISKGDDCNYSCFDALDRNISTISKDVVAKARTSDIKPFPPNSRGLYLLSKTSTILNRDYIIRIVNKNMEVFLNSNDHGINKFNSFLRQLELIASMIDNGKYAVFFNVQLEFLCKYIREFESTQSFYRLVYFDFLKEINNKYALSIDNNIDLCLKLGNAWHKIGSEMNDMKKQNIAIREKIKIIITRLYKINDLEKEFAERMIESCK